MKNKIQENQFVISKMTTHLVPEVQILDDIYKENWLHTPNDKNNLISLSAKYQFNFGDLYKSEPIEINQHFSIKHAQCFQCCLCQKKIKKLYSGYCYVCLTQKAAADYCVINPYKCHFINGTCREPEWGLSFCYQPHYVYLAFTDKYKVGITRKNQILTRWVDQGATMASPICLTQSRHQAGTLEKMLMEILSDKSHWQKMLKSGNTCPTIEEFNLKLEMIHNFLKENFLTNSLIERSLPKETEPKNDVENFNFFANPQIVKIQYPLQNETQEKITSISLDKQSEIQGKITGIKGQYLFFEDKVFNMRSHEGYVIEIESNA